MGKININLIFLAKLVPVILIVIVLIVLEHFRMNEIKPDMTKVEGGMIQCSDLANYDDPDNEIAIIKDFFIGKYEVTQASYTIVMGENPSHFNRTNRNLPVEQVSWYEAVEFCNKLSKKSGLDTCYFDYGDSLKCDFEANGYRLPTRLEWTYAAKGGKLSKSYKYPGSNKVNKVIWYANNSKDTPHKVGKKKANELGIHDMGGNVNEWCWDGIRENSERCYCGGSFESNDKYCVFTYLCTAQPDSSRYDLGLRLCRSSK